jgi:hypothetical protein
MYTGHAGRYSPLSTPNSLPFPEEPRHESQECEPQVGGVPDELHAALFVAGNQGVE